MTAGRERMLAHVIAVLAVAACWVAIILDGDRIKSLDEIAFVAIAENLAFDSTFAEEAGTPTAYRAPGLVFFLAPFVRMGAGLMELRMLNALLVGLSLLLAFSLVRRHAGAFAGLCAVAMIPAWPVVIYAATTLYPQTLTAFLLVLTLWLLDRLDAEASLRTTLAAGLAAGALVLTVPVVLLLMPVLFFWIVLRCRRGLLHGLAFAAVSAAMVGSWTVRNYVAFDTFIPVATSSGYNLLAGNTAQARYDTSLDVRFPEYVYTEITGKDEVAANKIFTRAAVREVKDDPARAAMLYLGKFLHWFDYSNKLLSDEAVEGGASRVGADAREAVLFVTYCAVIAIPLVAHLLWRRRFPFRPIEVLFLCLWIGAGLAYAIFFTRVRFRMPFDWLVIASNAMFLAAVLEGAVARRRKAPLPGAPGAAAPERR